MSFQVHFPTARTQGPAVFRQPRRAAAWKPSRPVSILPATACLHRFDLPGIARHVVPRGSDRQPCLAAPADGAGYLGELGAAAIERSDGRIRRDPVLALLLRLVHRDVRTAQQFVDPRRMRGQSHAEGNALGRFAQPYRLSGHSGKHRSARRRLALKISAIWHSVASPAAWP
jgi:hypothetical protein